MFFNHTWNKKGRPRQQAKLKLHSSYAGTSAQEHNIRCCSVLIAVTKNHRAAKKTAACLHQKNSYAST